MSETPESLYALPVKIDKPGGIVAAAGDSEKNLYAVHMVNKGATKNVELSGLPATVTEMDLFLTDKENSF